MNDTDLEGFRPDHYFSRAWALLTRDRGWIKPVLVMSAAALVPVVGMLGILGYIVEWARLTAWGVNSSPKQRNVQVGGCIASGARAFVVMLVWGICWGVVGGLLVMVPLLGGLLSFAWTIVNLFVSLVIMIAVLRATIYQKIVAGLRVTRIWKMATHDLGGVMRVFGLQVAGGALIALAAAVVTLVALMSALPSLVYYSLYLYDYGSVMAESLQASIALELLASLLGAALPALLVLYVLGTPATIVLAMLVYTALALWMRQFDVPSWGREEDPLPFETRGSSDWAADTLPPVVAPTADTPAVDDDPAEKPAEEPAPADEPALAPDAEEAPAGQDESPVAPADPEPPSGDGPSETQDTPFE